MIINARFILKVWRKKNKSNDRKSDEGRRD